MYWLEGDVDTPRSQKQLYCRCRDYPLTQVKGDFLYTFPIINYMILIVELPVVENMGKSIYLIH